MYQYCGVTVLGLQAYLLWNVLEGPLREPEYSSPSLRASCWENVRRKFIWKLTKSQDFFCYCCILLAFSPVRFLLESLDITSAILEDWSSSFPVCWVSEHKVKCTTHLDLDNCCRRGQQSFAGSSLSLFPAVLCDCKYLCTFELLIVWKRFHGVTSESGNQGLTPLDQFIDWLIDWLIF